MKCVSTKNVDLKWYTKYLMSWIRDHAMSQFVIFYIIWRQNKTAGNISGTNIFVDISWQYRFSFKLVHDIMDNCSWCMVQKIEKQISEYVDTTDKQVVWMEISYRKLNNIINTLYMMWLVDVWMTDWLARLID